MRLGAHDKAAKSNACCVFDTLGNSFLVAVHDFAFENAIFGECRQQGRGEFSCRISPAAQQSSFYLAFARLLLVAMLSHTACLLSLLSLNIQLQTLDHFHMVLLSQRACWQHILTAMMLFLQGAFWISVSFKALHESMLCAFSREAAWLMQACEYKSG